MASWDETTGRDMPDDSLLSDDELERCARADAGVPRTPIPTQMVSNGEYMPLPQSAQQKRVEARVNDLAGVAARRLGVSRRQFLAGSGGMAASFLAMNRCSVITSTSIRCRCCAAAYAQSAPPRDLFVFDDQLHMVRGSRYDAAAPARARAGAELGLPVEPLITGNAKMSAVMRGACGTAHSSGLPNCRKTFSSRSHPDCISTAR